MKNLALILFSMTILAACGSAETQGPGKIYAKVNLKQLQACSLSTSCKPSESCTSYSTSQSYCYQSGRESDIVGCTKGELIIMQSEPGQAGCL